MQTKLDVLVVDDEPALREVLSLRIADWGHEVRAVAEATDADRAFDAKCPDVVLCDVVLPRSSGLALLYRFRERNPNVPIVMITAHGNIDSAVDAMKAGARDFLTKPIDHAMLRALLENIAADLGRRQATRALDAQLARVTGGGATLVGQTRAMRQLQSAVEVIASSDASVIITGESGTGKEVVARVIHERSARRAKPFVAINAAAIPEGLVESEIFGHEQGAFTGATKARAGCFELAEGGTLFLDELAEMPIALQPKLLRVLEDNRARRLGGSRDIRFDVRVLAATNRAVREAIRDGRLREDLFYRLNVFEIVVPPLRERSDDIALLAQHFVREFHRKHRLDVEGVSEDAVQLLHAHSWPGNVRELRNVIERAVILARCGWIEPRHLPPYVQTLHAGSPTSVSIPSGTTLAAAEQRLIAHTLERSGGNKAEAARQLGVDVKTLRNKLRQFATNGTRWRGGDNE